MSDEQRLSLLRILSLLLVVGISVFIFSIRERVEDFAAYGYPGIFLVSLLASATVLLPAPGLAVVFAMGAVFNPIGVAIAASLGAAIGEISGYLAGFSGRAVIEQMDIYEKISPWVDKYGFWAIMVLGAIPNPFFDLAGIAAGAGKMQVRKFILAAWCGQIIKMSIFAFAGSASLNWFFS